MPVRYIYIFFSGHVAFKSPTYSLITWKQSWKAPLAFSVVNIYLLRRVAHCRSEPWARQPTFRYGPSGISLVHIPPEWKPGKQLYFPRISCSLQRKRTFPHTRHSQCLRPDTVAKFCPAKTEGFYIPADMVDCLDLTEDAGPRITSPSSVTVLRDKWHTRQYKNPNKRSVEEEFANIWVSILGMQFPCGKKYITRPEKRQLLDVATWWYWFLLRHGAIIVWWFSKLRYSATSISPAVTGADFKPSVIKLRPPSGYNLTWAGSLALKDFLLECLHEPSFSCLAG